MKTCPVCSCPVKGRAKHTDDQCVDALIETGTFATFPYFNCKIPPPEKWSEQEREFARQLAMQGIAWRKAEIAQ